MRTAITWILTAFLALAFLAAGGFKLTTPAMEVQLFSTFGLPLWTLYAVAGFEIVCAIGLLVPRYAAPAATLLACDMVVAFLLHLTHGQVAMAPAALVLGIIAAVVAYLRGGLRPFAGFRFGAV